MYGSSPLQNPFSYGNRYIGHQNFSLLIAMTDTNIIDVVMEMQSMFGCFGQIVVSFRFNFRLARTVP